MNQFKFLKNNNEAIPIWLPSLYQEMVIAIMRNQCRTISPIIGAQHSFNDSDGFRWLLRILNLEPGLIVTYQVENLITMDNNRYTMHIDDYIWRSITII